jgi:hypothetical protein
MGFNSGLKGLNPLQATSESTFAHSALLLVLEHCLWKVPSLRPFVLQVRATCGCVWSICGMMTEENPSSLRGGKPVPCATMSTINLT